MANGTEYGLACYFYTDSLQRIVTFSEGLEYGLGGGNEGIISTEVALFGGIRESGVGRDGAKQGMDEYLETKYVCLGGGLNCPLIYPNWCKARKSGLSLAFNRGQYQSQ